MLDVPADFVRDILLLLGWSLLGLLLARVLLARNKATI